MIDHPPALKKRVTVCLTLNGFCLCTNTLTLTHTHCFGSHILCVPQMLRLWRRDVPLLGGNVPAAAAPSPPPTAAPTGPNISWIPEAPLLSPDKPIFLMTPAAQAVSGFFVWTALILTCHQVNVAEKKKQNKHS